MSERASASLLSNCSGDMYCRAPSRVPSTVTVRDYGAGATTVASSRKAAVEQLNTGFRHQQVAWFEIPVNDAVPVSGRELLWKSYRVLERFRHSQRRAERLTL